MDARKSLMRRLKHFLHGESCVGPDPTGPLGKRSSAQSSSPVIALANRTSIAPSAATINQNGPSQNVQSSANAAAHGAGGSQAAVTQNTLNPTPPPSTQPSPSTAPTIVAPSVAAQNPPNQQAQSPVVHQAVPNALNPTANPASPSNPTTIWQVPLNQHLVIAAGASDSHAGAPGNGHKRTATNEIQSSLQSSVRQNTRVSTIMRGMVRPRSVRDRAVQAQQRAEKEAKLEEFYPWYSLKWEDLLHWLETRWPDLPFPPVDKTPVVDDFYRFMVPEMLTDDERLEIYKLRIDQQ